MKKSSYHHGTHVVASAAAVLVLLGTAVHATAIYQCTTTQTASVSTGEATVQLGAGCVFDDGGGGTLSLTVDVGTALDAAVGAGAPSATFDATGAAFKNTNIVISSPAGHATTIPYMLTMQGCDYQAAAESITFTGVFPAGSMLNVSGNDMVWTTTAAIAVGGIALADAVLQLGSTLLIASNRMTALGKGRVLITTKGATNITGSSALLVSSNTATFNHSASTSYRLGFVFLAVSSTDLVEIDGGSSVNVTNNVVACPGPSYVSLFMVLGIQAGTVSLSGQSHMSLDSTHSTVGLGQTTFQFGLRSGTLLVSGASNISVFNTIMQGNSSNLQYVALVAMFWSTWDVSGGSTVHVWNNSIDITTTYASTSEIMVHGIISGTFAKPNALYFREGSTYLTEDTDVYVSASSMSTQFHDFGIAKIARGLAFVSGGSKIIRLRTTIRGSIAFSHFWYCGVSMDNGEIIISGHHADMEYGGMYGVSVGSQYDLSTITGNSNVTATDLYFFSKSGSYGRAAFLYRVTMNAQSTFLASNVTIHITVPPTETSIWLVTMYLSSNSDISGGSRMLVDNANCSIYYDGTGNAYTSLFLILSYGTFSNGTMAVSNSRFHATVLGTRDFNTPLYFGKPLASGGVVSVTNTVIDLVWSGVATSQRSSIMSLSSIETGTRTILNNNNISLHLTYTDPSEPGYTTSPFGLDGLALTSPTTDPGTHPLIEFTSNRFQLHVSKLASGNCAAYAGPSCNIAGDPSSPIPFFDFSVGTGWDRPLPGGAIALTNNEVSMTADTEIIGASAALFAVSTPTTTQQAANPLPITSLNNRFTVQVLNASATIPPLYGGWLANGSVSLTACGDRVESGGSSLRCVDGTCYPHGVGINISVVIGIACTHTQTITPAYTTPFIELPATTINTSTDTSTNLPNTTDTSPPNSTNLGPANALFSPTMTTTAQAPAVLFICAAGTPIEVQAMVWLLGTDCGSEADHESVKIAQYFVSPFAQSGEPGVAALGNVGLAVAVLLAHCLVVLVVRCISQSRSEEKEEGSDNKQLSPMGTALFPGASMVFARVAYLGAVVYGLQGLRIGGPAVNIAGGVIALVFAVCVPAAHVYCLIAVVRGGGTYREYDWRAAGVGAWKRWAYPSGRWEDRDVRQRYSWVVSPYRGGWRRWASVVPMCAAVVLLGVPLAAVPASAGCTGLFVVPCVGCIVIGCAYIATMPRRSTVQSVLTGVCYLLVGVIGVAQAVAANGTSDTSGLKTGASFALMAVAVLRGVHSVVVVIIECMTTPKPLDTVAAEEEDPKAVDEQVADNEDDAILHAIVSEGTESLHSNQKQLEEDNGIVMLADYSNQNSAQCSRTTSRQSAFSVQLGEDKKEFI